MTASISVKDDIFNALVALLATITTAANYRTDVKKVHGETVPIGKLTDIPAITAEQGPDVQIKRSLGLIFKKWTIWLDFWVHSQDNLQSTIRKAEADLEDLFYNDRFTTGLGISVSGTAYELRIVSFDPFGTSVNKPNGGVTCEIEIYYHQRDTNSREKA